jgi:uncharacterized damage-inducible protein DinB
MRQNFFTKFPLFAVLILLAVPGFRAAAQPITGDQIKVQFIQDWQRAKAYTLEYLNTMPAGKYSFRPVDSIRTFAQQMLHLADDNIYLAEDATGEKITWEQREVSPTAQSKDSVVWYVTRSYDFAIGSITKLDPNKYGEIVKYGDDAGPRLSGRATRYVLLLKAFEHQTHHRGQTTIYIRLLGIRPPGERLF